MRTLHLDLDHAAESASRARRAVRGALLSEWPHAQSHEALCDLVEDAELVTSELVANAFRHGGAPATIDLEASRDDDLYLVRIMSRDAGVWRDVELDGAGGRGLLMVESLCVDLHVDRRPPGTTVTALLVRRVPAQPPAPSVARPAQVSSSDEAAAPSGQ